MAQDQTPHLFGFTLLRNGVRYDYPFRESLRSLAGVTEKIALALGKSDDGTEGEIRNLGLPIECTPTVWDENLRKGGVILSQQTNIALEALRKIAPKGSWGIYLQGDEVLLESDYSRIREDIAQADRTGCDAVSFRYLHFWQDYSKIAVGKRWYPQEIRAIKLDTPIESYGDAQSFKNAVRVFQSDAWIYHIGHVREAEKYQKKLQDFHRWWHSDEEMKKVAENSKEKDAREECVYFFGPFPTVLKTRMEKHYGGKIPFEGVKLPRVGLLGLPKDEFDRDLVRKISAQETRWGTLSELKRWGADTIVPIYPTLLEKLLSRGEVRSSVPESMKSPQARVWSESFVKQLKLYERGVALTSNPFSS